MIFTGEVQVFKIDFSQVPRMASIRLLADSNEHIGPLEQLSPHLRGKDSKDAERSLLHMLQSLRPQEPGPGCRGSFGRGGEVSDLEPYSS